MSLYHVSLYVHILGVLGMFIAAALGFVSLIRLRGARTVEQAREWSGLDSLTGAIHPISGVLILLSGVVMVFIQWGWQTAWINVALVALLLLSVWGATINGRRLQAIHTAASAAPSGPLTTNLARLIADPVLWTSMFASATFALGIICLMVFKPDLIASLLTLIIAAVLGALAAQLIGRGSAAATGVS